MKIIVTGGAGFLGRHLCRALASAQHEVTVIDLVENPEFKTIIADVRDSKAMNEHIKDVDVVFHLASLIEAGESVKKPLVYIDYNINGTATVLEAMRLNGLKSFIFSSSAAIYGEPERVPISEDDRTLPINPYGMTKLAMEGLLRSYCETSDFSGVALRYFNLYGPEEHHQPETHAIPRFIDQIYHQKEVTIWGDGSHLRDYVYITDIVEAHLLALNLISKKPNQYHYLNLSTENPSSVIKVVETISKLLDKQAQIKHYPARPGDPLQLSADAGKAHQELGWSAKTDLHTGLEQTVNYFMSYFSKKEANS